MSVGIHLLTQSVFYISNKITRFLWQLHVSITVYNSLLTGVSAKNLDKLQCTQYRAARIVCNVGRRQSSSRDLFAVLHWLPVRQRIDYKLATLCFKVTMTGDDQHWRRCERLGILCAATVILVKVLFTAICLLLYKYLPQRTLRSTAKELLIIPPHQTVLGSRRFSMAAPTVRNELPITLRFVDNFKTLKTGLETHLFRRFMDWIIQQRLRLRPRLNLALYEMFYYIKGTLARKNTPPFWSEQKSYSFYILFIIYFIRRIRRFWSEI